KQRHAHRLGRLLPERLSVLESVNPAWCPDREGETKQQWLERLEQYRYFHAEHGYDPPKRSLDENEKRLGIWLSRQRQAHRRGKLSPEGVAALELVNPDWCPDREKEAKQQ